MTLSSGMQFHSYLICESIGVGGMGEVYRATDTKLKRDVAIKVLPESLAADAERLARFQREAELLASLNHTNIAQIFGLESSAGVIALVMELIEGPTLAERIEQGAIPPDEALNIALQIAAALEAAHSRGIIHRDLKPANIKLRPDGTVKVLDFGIAKALELPGNGGPASPVLTTPAMTMSGTILGTAAYMSPEQARGKPVDERADIWAFGCVLHEMLTGQPVFGGEDVTTTLARVLEREIDLNVLPATLSSAVRHTIKLCLRKDPKKRIRHISDVRLALEGEFGNGIAQTAARATTRGKGLWLLAVAALIVVAIATTWWLKPVPLQDMSINRFAYAFPEAHVLTNTDRNVLAVSPDGRRFAYNTAAGLFVRELGQLEAQLVSATESGISTPIFSPDSQSLAYESNNRFSRIAIAGGGAIVISSVIGQRPVDASWAADNNIYYGQNTGIWRVPAMGGAPELLIDSRGQELMFGPELLPDGDTLLYAVLTLPSTFANNRDSASIVAQSLTTGVRKVLVQGGSDPQYVPTGHLVYANGDGLFAVALDLATLTISGGNVPLVQGLVRASSTSNYRVSNNGTLMYLSGPSLNESFTLAWVNRDGSETPIAMEPGNFSYPRISPDGGRVVLGDGGQTGLWIWDFSAETMTQLTIGEAGGNYGAWTADGTRLAYTGTMNSIDWKAANNTGQAARMTNFTSTGGQQPSVYFFSPSGQELVYRNQATAATDDDIAMISVGGTAEPVMLLNDTWIERNAELAPNGRWMAYQSNESGQFEIYVRPFPNVDDDRVQVSNAGGEKPLWSRDGTELFYLQQDATASQAQLMSVAVAPDEARFAFDTRAKVMDWPYLFSAEGRTYEIAPDGRRFLALKAFVDPAAGEQEPPQVVIVQNWTEELKRLVPVEL